MTATLRFEGRDRTTGQSSIVYQTVGRAFSGVYSVTHFSMCQVRFRFHDRKESGQPTRSLIAVKMIAFLLCLRTNHSPFVARSCRTDIGCECCCRLAECFSSVAENIENEILSVNTRHFKQKYASQNKPLWSKQKSKISIDFHFW